TLHVSATPGWVLPVCVAYERGGTRASRCVIVEHGEVDEPLGAPCPRWFIPDADGAGFYTMAPWPSANLAAVVASWKLLTPGVPAVARDAVARAAQSETLGGGANGVLSAAMRADSKVPDRLLADLPKVNARTRYQLVELLARAPGSLDRVAQAPASLLAVPAR